MVEAEPLIEVENISKYFGSVIALEDISMKVHAGEVMCLLGDNGAGKSTLIKILSGVHPPTKGRMLVEGEEINFGSPRDALDTGIATVYQDLATIPLMSISRNFFLGREPLKGKGPWRRFDTATADRITYKQLEQIGIDVRDTSQAVGTLSGGERQSVAIARAIYFGAKVLILDEPTSALGVKQASIVLRYIAQARQQGIAVIFISHNVYHAAAIGDRFTVLNHGRSEGTFEKDEVSTEELEQLMAGGGEMDKLTAELEKFERAAKESEGADTAEESHQEAEKMTGE